MAAPSAGRVPAAVSRTLADIADALAGTSDAWWLIGGGALALHGLTAIEVADIDILMSARDARQVLASLRIVEETEGGTDLFRSDVFARSTVFPIPVDFMGNLSLRTAGHWHRIELTTRCSILVEGRPIYVPSQEELIRICRLFGRPKDLARAAVLSGMARQADNHPNGGSG